jgi:hypothetical protein
MKKESLSPAGFSPSLLEQLEVLHQVAARQVAAALVEQ